MVPLRGEFVVNNLAVERMLARAPTKVAASTQAPKGAARPVAKAHGLSE